MKSCYVLFIVCAISMISCSSSDSSSGYSPGPTENPTLSISDPTDGSCISLAEDSTYFSVQISTTELYLRPEGSCQYYDQCGHVVLYLNDVKNNVVAGTSIDVLLDDQENIYQTWTVRVDIINDSNEILYNHEDPAVPLTSTISVTTSQVCGE